MPPGRLPQSTGLNVLDRLADQRDTPWKPREAGQSQTLSDALQRAFQYPSFDQLTRRADAEGIFQAAAWALACRGAATAGGTSMSAGNAAKSQISTQTGAQANNDAEMRLRCSDARFATPGFADRKLLEAVAAGQAGAMMVWMQLHPGQWMDAALPDGTPLSDRLFAMAAHGDATALLLLRQHCSRPGACADAVLTRNVLAVLAVERVKGNWPPNGEQSLEGTPDERRRAVTRAAALRSSLPTWRTP
ncbi:hypothetical protein DIE19_35310 [Burkholderia sp. Bp9126]|nr:hypothetical protein DIE19_35310 [Burkholderia sp. Bp9126]